MKRFQIALGLLRSNQAVDQVHIIIVYINGMVFKEIVGFDGKVAVIDMGESLVETVCRPNVSVLI